MKILSIILATTVPLAIAAPAWADVAAGTPVGSLCNSGNSHGNFYLRDGK